MPACLSDCHCWPNPMRIHCLHIIYSLKSISITLFRCCSKFSLASLVSWTLLSKAKFTVALCCSISCLVSFRSSSITPQSVAEAFCSLSAFRMFSLEKDAHWSGVTELKTKWKIFKTQTKLLYGLLLLLLLALELSLSLSIKVKFCTSFFWKCILNTSILLWPAVFSNHSIAITYFLGLLIIPIRLVFSASVSTSQGHSNCLILVWISHEFGYKRLDFLVPYAAAIVMDIHPLCILHLLLETYYHIH